MRRRPQPNPRRGLLRAGIAVVVLIVVLLVVIEVVSSLTAPPAKAPIIPPTPAKPVLPTPRATPPGTPPATPRATPRATARSTAHATAKPKRDVAVARAPLAEVRPRRPVHTAFPVARFAGSGDAYQGRMLVVSSGQQAGAISIGRADPYVRPVWSHDGQSLLFVTVRPTRAIPGAAWTLHLFNLATRRSRPVVTQTAMGLWPLGWRHGKILYALSNGSDTSLYTWSGTRSRFLTILIPQVVSAPSLSPDGNTVAFATPADCSYCALSLFDLQQLTTWFGPAGLPSEYDVAWTADGRDVVTILDGRIRTIDVASHDSMTYRLPSGFPSVWPHPVVATQLPGALRLIDETTGRSYVARAVSR